MLSLFYHPLHSKQKSPTRKESMSEFTPTKNIESQTTLTPVWYSPSYNTKSTSSDSNVAACKSRLEAIVKTTLEHFHKWRLADKRGLQLCIHIESIKTKVLEQMNASTLPADFTLYPSSMKQYCDNLATMATVCMDIVERTKESLKQLNALSKLPGSCNQVFYRSWQMPEFIEFLKDLVERYETEAEVKRAVSENLPHCITRPDVIRWTSLWEYPQHVDFYVQLSFAFLKEELNNKSTI